MRGSIKPMIPNITIFIRHPKDRVFPHKLNPYPHPVKGDITYIIPYLFAANKEEKKVTISIKMGTAGMM
jgi:hypothetical protein